MKHLIFILTGPLVLFIILMNSCKPSAQDAKVSTELTRKEQLGKLLFFEKSLSTPVGQDCAACHNPDFAFADPDTGLPVSKGAVDGCYGNRNDMPAAYAAYVPPLHKDTVENIWVGGLFWDGRANSLEEQAMGPPLNPLEMANPDTLAISNKLRALEYAGMFTEIYGPGALHDQSSAFRNMADAIAAYERSAELNRFDSKYDLFLKGEAELSEQETRGMGLFVAEKKGNCAACHPSTPSADGTPPLFTDFTYDNLGVPRNPENPFYTLSRDLNPDGFDYVDLGLALTVNDPAENGKFRVPTLRNVALTPPYMHNGVFKTLFQVVAFYNTRDTGRWPPPEVTDNVNDEELGDLGLSNREMEDIVAFLLTLSDGWKPEKPVQQ
jgi:cytochrome c peroxidase